MSLTIDTISGSYPVIIEERCFEKAAEFVKNKCLIVTDSNVAPLYLDSLKSALKDFEVHSIVMEAGEKSKCQKCLFTILDKLAELEFNRKDTVIALGGGVMGDLTGLAAGLYMRGIPLLMMPTTLLAMVDSSCGGKVAVNHPMGKNMIGMFYQPMAVIESLHTLSTLDAEQIGCGSAEIIKYGCIHDRELFEGLKEKDKVTDKDVLRRCVEIKNYYVTRDTLDKGLRMTLNFGHTIGHCVEKDKGLLHGNAVAIGMYQETLLSERLGITKAGTAEQIRTMLEIHNLPWEIPQDCNIEKYLYHDKKGNKDGITFAFVSDIGTSVLKDVSYSTLQKELLC